MREGNRQAKLIRLMVSLCNNMGAQVVAEGIETIQELLVAERAGADFCQGFLLGRPGPSPTATPGLPFTRTIENSSSAI